MNLIIPKNYLNQYCSYVDYIKENIPKSILNNDIELVFEEGTISIKDDSFERRNALDSYGEYHDLLKSKIVSVIIPNSVKDIGTDAFRCCLLKRVVIPKDVIIIGDNSFCECANLQEVILSDFTREIGFCAFFGCHKLKNINLDKVARIGKLAFNYCNSLECIDLSNCEFIAERAFSSCLSLNEVDMPFKMNNYIINLPFELNNDLIGMNTFSGCKSLLDIIIPDGILHIPYKCFEFCNFLERIVISNSVKSIDSYAFSNCESLEEITMPIGILKIGTNAFNNCINLKTIIFEDSSEFDISDYVSSIYKIHKYFLNAYEKDTLTYVVKNIDIYNKLKLILPMMGIVCNIEFLKTGYEKNGNNKQIIKKY